MSARLAMLARLVLPCACAADVGADHGRLGAMLLQEGVCARLVACDVSARALSKARALYEALGLCERVRLHTGDGLSGLAPGEAQAIVCAGMGAVTMTGVLERGLAVIGDSALILSPTLGHGDVRRFLQRNGFALEQEALCRERGRFYVAMRARRGAAPPLTPAQEELGCYLGGSPLFSAYLRWRIGVAARMQTPQGRALHAVLAEAGNREEEGAP